MSRAMLRVEACGSSAACVRRVALKDVAARYHLVAMDPRFTGRSRPAVDCRWDDVSEWRRSAGSDRAEFDRMVAFNRTLADDCRRTPATVHRLTLSEYRCGGRSGPVDRTAML